LEVGCMYQATDVRVWGGEKSRVQGRRDRAGGGGRGLEGGLFRWTLQGYLAHKSPPWEPTGLKGEHGR